MKSIFSSKTFWLAVLQALIGVSVVFSTAYPSVGAIVLVKSVLDIIIRIYTTQTVSVLG